MTALGYTVSIGRRVAYLHLANDIIQNSRRKGNEYILAFQKVLPEALEAAVKWVFLLSFQYTYRITMSTQTSTAGNDSKGESLGQYLE
jgi:hypothetical protein